MLRTLATEPRQLKKANEGVLTTVDMSGAMPRKAWIEVRDEEGNLLGTFQSKITGGTVSTDLPGFKGGIRGTMTTFTEEVDGEIHRQEEELMGLPDQPTIMMVQMG